MGRRQRALAGGKRAKYCGQQWQTHKNNWHNERDNQRSLKLAKFAAVLLVEDSPDNRFLIKELLGQMKIEVETAVDGLDGIEKVRKSDFDVVLMDMQMPVLDGYAATQRLRSEGFKKPILALTASVLAEEKLMALAAGCNAYLTKPLNRNELLATIYKWTVK